MELKLLEDFLCLADLRSFSRAAESRHVTQSTLSKRIRTLEHWLGTDLVDRSEYPISLTQAGAALVTPTREIVQMMRGLRESVRELAVPAPDEIVFGGLHTLLVSFMPAFRTELEARLGPLRLTPHHQNAAYAATLRTFRNDDMDLLLTYSHPAVAMNLAPERFETLTLAQERVLPVSAPGPDGAALHRIRPDTVLRYLSYGTTSFFASALSDLFAERPLALNIMATNPMSVGLRSLALVGNGLAWLPESLVRRDLAEGRLVLGGGEDWEFSVDIVLCRSLQSRRPLVDRVWEAAVALSEHGQSLLGRELLL